jgi:hypothetical protein
MGLFLFLIWCTTAARAVLRPNSRNSLFGVFNSRLGAKKFPFSRPRELADKALILLAILRTKSALFGENRKNSQLCGNNRELRFPAKAVRRQPTVAPVCSSVSQ